MSLQFIFGAAGTGKTYTMYTNMIEASIKNPSVNYIAIVPEQFTMEAQKKMVSLHPKKGVMYIDILSFNRLALRVFGELGENDINVIDDTAKSLIIRKVLEENKNELTVYGKKIAMNGFVDKMKSAISQLQQYGVDIEQMEKMLSSVEERPMLHGKLSDIKVTYGAFLDMIAEKYVTAEEILERLGRVVPQSDLIKNSEIYIDGFTGFTPVQYKLIEELITYARKVTVAVTLPAEQAYFNTIKEQELFNLSKTTVKKLGEIADRSNIVIDRPIIVRENEHSRLSHNTQLKYLEKNLFRFNAGKVYEGEHNAISIHVCTNPKEEAEYVAYTIVNMVRENGMRYKDFAVITAGMEQYYRYIDRAFEKYSIPNFIDYKRNISGNPFINTIKSALEVIEKNYAYESVFNFLRFGMTDISADEIDRLDNYVLQNGIRGRKMWESEFKNMCGQMRPEELQAINATRSKAAGMLSELADVFKDRESTAEQFTRGIYDFIIKNDLYTKLKEYEDEFDRQGKLSAAAEYGQTYSETIKLFDKIVKLFGDEKISLKEYKEILSSGFDSIKVGVIPPTIDKVVVGDMERTRLDDVKVLFFIGINDKIIPRSASQGDIITDYDKEVLLDKEFELAPTAREKAFIERFYLYLALTKPSEKLFLSFSKTSASGETMMKSYLINLIMNMFPHTAIVDECDNKDILRKIVSDDTAIAELSSGLWDYLGGENKEIWESLYYIYDRNPAYRTQMNNLYSASSYRGNREKLTKEMAEALYGKGNIIGITRLERYAECAYMQFLANGIALQERKEHKIAAVDMGNLYHNAIDMFCRSLDTIGIKWTELDGGTRKKLVKDCVERVVEEYDNKAFVSSARSRYLTKRIERMTDKTVWVLSEHLKAGGFEPIRYEMKVSSGRVDRVDLYEMDDEVYVKVIDYKSGSKEFSLIDTYYGLQLQLIAYIKDVLEVEKSRHPNKKIIPAGVFYYNIKDPYINKKDIKSSDNLSDEKLYGVTEDDIRRTQYDRFNMSGVINKAALEMLDKGLAENKTSSVIPVKFTQKGYKSKYPLVDSDEFDKLIGYVDKKKKSMEKEILEGHIEINPCDKTPVPCEYCKYKSVCGFDLKAPGTRYRELKKLSNDEIWQEIEKDDAVD